MDEAAGTDKGRAALGPRVRALVEGMRAEWAGLDRRIGARERRPEERKAISRANARTLLGQARENRAPYSRAAAAATRTPTLLLHGANTLPDFVANVQALGGAIPGARIGVIPGATHGLTFENPTAFNAAVLEFLRARWTGPKAATSKTPVHGPVLRPG